MIAWDQFYSLVTDPTGLNKRIDRDDQQAQAVRAAANQSLFIVAGPGSGKTTVRGSRATSARAAAVISESIGIPSHL
jgi:hypothetical protein